MSRINKSYKQFCGVAKALDVVGERWTLLIVRDLLLGPLRYSDFERTLVGLTPNLLSKRLRDLLQAGVIRKSEKPDRRYALTELGHTLEPVVLGLGAFGAQFMAEPQNDERLDPRWAMLSLKRRYRGCSAAGSLLLRLGADEFWVGFEGLKIDVRALDACSAAPPLPVQAQLSGGLAGWFPLLSARQGLRCLLADGALSRTGPARPTEAFVRALGLRV